MNRLFRYLFLVASAAGLSGCGGYYNDFDIVNGTKAVIRDVSVSDGAAVWTFGDLKPGAHANFHAHLGGEGTGKIAWTLNGKRYSADGCFYTVGSSTHGILTVVGDHLDYRCT
jgi:hypothetical protein